MRFFLMMLALSSSVAAHAAQRPKLPPTCEEDSTLVGDSGAAAFFAARAANTECQGRLTTAREAWERGRTPALRKRYLERVQECGPCAVKKPLYVEVRNPPEPLERWYVADGSCQLAGPRERVAGAVRGLSQSLKVLKRYPAKHGGFSDVLEFRGVDGKSGALLPESDTPVASSPFFAFVAVRGPALGPLQTAASYFIRNELKKDDSEFRLEFRSDTAPEDFRAPSLPYTELPLPHSKGLWCLQQNGYVRYFTAADFPVTTSLASELAKRVLLDTLVQLLERPEAKL